MKKYKGLLISFEGIDGSGKSSVIKNIYEELKNNYEVEITREPGGNNVVSEKIRDILLNNKVEPETEAYLFAASRNEHTKKYIIPALKDGKIILCDRYLDSSLVYQGIGRKIGYKKVEKLNDFGINGFRPNFVFYLDINPDISFQRTKNDGRSNNVLDDEAYLMKNKIYEGFNLLAKKNRKNHIVVDASKPLDEVIRNVLDKLKKIIEEHYENK